MTGRRRSVSSDSSSCSSNNDREKHSTRITGPGYGPSIPQQFPSPGQHFMSGEHLQTGQRSPHPPPYTGQGVQSPPPSGFRIPLTTGGPFPQQNQTLQPPFRDLDGSPVFFGSALLEKSVHPCKIAPNISPPCRVSFGGQELLHQGRYDLLLYTPDTMELVPASGGRVPYGKRPVEGGYEEGGAKLYHAVAMINGVKVPGKTGEHLYGCNVPFGGGEHCVTHDYEVLCWRH